MYWQAPTLYDDREPIDYQLSEIGLATARPMAAAWEAKIWVEAHCQTCAILMDTNVKCSEKWRIQN